MAEIVTLDEAKAHLRIVGSEDDDDLQAKLDVAHELVLDYVKQRRSGMTEWVQTVDAWTDQSAPKVVYGAIARMFGHLARFRGDDEYRGDAQLPAEVRMLLDGKRDPALA